VGLPRRNRLRSPRDFDAVTRAGPPVTRPEFVLYHRAREAPDAPRIGFAVGRRIGSAVVRNRTRRILREGFRRLVPRLVPCDIVVVARPPVTAGSARDLEAALTEATARAGLLLTD
jgi:ribonuclease P protein component